MSQKLCPASGVLCVNRCVKSASKTCSSLKYTSGRWRARNCPSTKRWQTISCKAGFWTTASVMEPSPATPTAVSTGHDASPSPREAGVPTPAPSAKKTAKKDREAASSMSVSHFGEEHARLQADEKSAAVYYATQNRPGKRPPTFTVHSKVGSEFQMEEVSACAVVLGGPHSSALGIVCSVEREREQNCAHRRRRVFIWYIYKCVPQKIPNRLKAFWLRARSYRC